MDLEKIELHDALLHRMHIDYAAKIVRIDLQFYLTPESSKREMASLIFSKVDSVSHISDLIRHEDNAIAGNINYWIPQQEGLTYIYLVDGCIAIGAGNIEFKACQ